MTLSRKHRQVLAVLAVTTALCADQVTAAAPAFRPQVAQLAGRIVNRLTQSFGRTIAQAPQVLPRRREADARREARPSAPVAVAAALRPRLSPVEFCLPPPSV